VCSGCGPSCGTNVDVRWRTDVAADPERFVVIGSETRGGDVTPELAQTRRAGSRRFSARIRRAAKVRYVTVVIGDEGGAVDIQTVKVR
jgi:hypothetical protein